MKSTHLFSFFLISILLIMTGCAPVPAASEATGQTSLEGTSSAYPTQADEYPAPYPDSQVIPPIAQGETSQLEYPGSGSPEPLLAATNIQIPEPKPDSSIIVGKLFEKGKPIINATLYLADVLEDDDTGEFQVASYSRETSPRATVGQDGQFVFVDIKPGKYSLIFDNFATYVSLNDPAEADKPLIFLAEAGSITKLGDLDYEELPEP